MQIEHTLSGGNIRTLKGVEEVITVVSKNPVKLKELFECVFVDDEIVRMRASDALEKICREHPDWFRPFINSLLTDVSKIDQPSVQWHLAQMLAEINLNKTQSERAITILKHNLLSSDDWIVTNRTLESLAKFTRDGVVAKHEFIELLQSQHSSSYKSVVSRTNKLLREFNNNN